MGDFQKVMPAEVCDRLHRRPHRAVIRFNEELHLRNEA
jgi:hypothetical protein